MPSPGTSASSCSRTATDGRRRGSPWERSTSGSAGTVHGGAIFTLADAAFSAAANSHGVLALSIDASISYFQALQSGTLTAEAHEVARSPKLATYLIDVKDGSGALIAHFRGTVYRKSAAIGDVFAP